MKQIYLAGPLFSEAERQFNLQLTHKLEELGYNVFLPQRDGAELEKSPYSEMPIEERWNLIFEIDKQQVKTCDIFLCILDGRVPDEGACVELGMAHMHKELAFPEKRLIGFHTDMRGFAHNTKLNPMLSIPFDAIISSETELFQLLPFRR